MTLLAKNVLFTLVVPGTIAVWLPLYFTRAAHVPGPLHYWLAAPFFVLGTVLYVWTVMNFAVVGRGTPVPIDAPRRLVVVGPHRRVRNPMYLGVLSVLLGWVLLFTTRTLVVYALWVAVSFHLFVLVVEEPSLRRQFGDEYRRYCGAVHRWIPGLGLPTDHQRENT